MAALDPFTRTSLDSRSIGRPTRAERADRAVERQQAQLRQRERRDIREDVRSAAFKVDGVLALAEHAMAGVVEMDDTRRFLARSDPTLNMLLAEIEGQAVQQVRAIQRAAFSPWDL